MAGKPSNISNRLNSFKSSSVIGLAFLLTESVKTFFPVLIKDCWVLLSEVLPDGFAVLIYLEFSVLSYVAVVLVTRLTYGATFIN